MCGLVLFLVLLLAMVQIALLRLINQFLVARLDRVRR